MFFYLFSRVDLKGFAASEQNFAFKDEELKIKKQKILITTI